MLASNDEDLMALMVALVVVLEALAVVVLVASKVLLEVEALAVVADLMNNND